MSYYRAVRYSPSLYTLDNSYSQKIIWLEVAESNNDPSLITHYYLHAVEKLKGTGIMMLLIISVLYT